MHTYMGVVSLIGIFESAIVFRSWPMEMANVAFIFGSSKQGNARLASVGSI